MIGYSCKYAPVELIQAYGGEARLLDAEAADFSVAETLTHANLCCHAKALIQQAQGEEELVLTDCCDATRRAFDVLDAQKPRRFMFQFDLPHDDNGCARARFARELCRFAKAYGAYRQSAFSAERFLSACRDNSHLLLPDEPFIGILGARVSPQLLGMIRDAFPLPVVNLTCSGLRTLEEPPADAAGYSFEQLMDWYAGALLRMTPCMRMTDIAGRRMLYENENLRGIVYHTVKFCDYYGFEYADLKKRSAIPTLKIETDYTLAAVGQLSTRLGAFCESLGLSQTQIVRTKEKKGFYAGIDSGSTTTNMVVLDERKNMLAFAIVRTGPRAQTGAQAALDQVCQKLNVLPDDFAAIVATGYGRSHIPFTTDSRTEITCHAKGAHFLNPSARTIVDIGGQDSKVILLDPSGGRVKDFLMNDKCAAGTGRFLEMTMSRVGSDIASIDTFVEGAEPVTINSMCAVFAESEIIGLLAQETPPGSIALGCIYSICRRTAIFAQKLAPEHPKVFFSGGLAQSQVVREVLARYLGVESVTAHPLCQYNGAIGAAVLGWKRINR